MSKVIVAIRDLEPEVGSAEELAKTMEETLGETKLGSNG